MTHLAALALRPQNFLALVKKYMPITALQDSLPQQAVRRKKKAIFDEAADERVRNDPKEQYRLDVLLPIQQIVSLMKLLPDSTNATQNSMQEYHILIRATFIT